MGGKRIVEKYWDGKELSYYFEGYLSEPGLACESTTVSLSGTVLCLCIGGGTTGIFMFCYQTDDGPITRGGEGREAYNWGGLICGILWYHFKAIHQGIHKSYQYL